MNRRCFGQNEGAGGPTTGATDEKIQTSTPPAPRASALGPRRLPHGRSEESATTAGCVRRAQVLVEARELKTRDSYEADGTSQDSGAGTPEQMRTTVGTSSSLSGPLLTR